MAAAANASTVVVNCSTLSGSTELNGNVTCSQFAPGLGQTLNSISITISGSENGTIKLINNDANNH